MDEITVESGPLVIRVRPSTVRQGMMRTRLISEALAELQTGKLSDPDLALLRRYSYPDCMAGASETRGFAHWPLAFHEYLELPDEFCARWEQAVYTANPHWAPGYSGPKAMSPASSTPS